MSVTDDTSGPAMPDSNLLLELVQARMPFGKYKGELLIDLPEPYLVWFGRQGFPRGKLGEQLQTVLSIKSNGLMSVLSPLRQSGSR
jgi:uncharacterized protein (DUF3820 family)